MPQRDGQGHLQSGVGDVRDVAGDLLQRPVADDVVGADAGAGAGGSGESAQNAESSKAPSTSAWSWLEFFTADCAQRDTEYVRELRLATSRSLPHWLVLTVAEGFETRGPRYADRRTSAGGSCLLFTPSGRARQDAAQRGRSRSSSTLSASASAVRLRQPRSRSQPPAGESR
jgi:hypothetical protein